MAQVLFPFPVLARAYPGKSLFDLQSAAIQHSLGFNPLPTLQIVLRLKIPWVNFAHAQSLSAAFLVSDNAFS